MERAEKVGYGRKGICICVLADVPREDAILRAVRCVRCAVMSKAVVRASSS